MLQMDATDKPTLGKGELKEGASTAQPIFSSTTAGAPLGSSNIESVSQAQTAKLCVEAPFFSSKNTKQLRNYLAKINIYNIHLKNILTACFQPWPEAF